MKNLLRINATLLLILLTLLNNSCKKTSFKVPVLTTNTVTDITPVSATSGGEVMSDGGVTITSRGVCWGTTQNPTTDNFTCFSDGSTGAYICKLKELIPSTLYYVRSYVKNSTGISYGNEVTFTTLPPDPVSITDADGNTYNVVRVGSQVWMKENLKTTTWPDGTVISLKTTDFSWATLSVTSKAYCWYDNDPANKDSYGALYTWAAAQGACPTGWHVPTKDEWLTLGNPALVNNLQFGGCRSNIGAFDQKDLFGHWWTSTPVDAGNAWESIFDTYNGDKGIPSQYKFCGISVRCIKDN
jgi:hypothetical protein